METPHNHEFDIQFTCDECQEVQHIKGTIDALLQELWISGWPICPECANDMEHSTVN